MKILIGIGIGLLLALGIYLRPWLWLVGEYEDTGCPMR